MRSVQDEAIDVLESGAQGGEVVLDERQARPCPEGIGVLEAAGGEDKNHAIIGVKFAPLRTALSEKSGSRRV